MKTSSVQHLKGRSSALKKGQFLRLVELFLAEELQVAQADDELENESDPEPGFA
jgi:hypothetical protein